LLQSRALRRETGTRCGRRVRHAAVEVVRSIAATVDAILRGPGRIFLEQQFEIQPAEAVDVGFGLEAIVPVTRERPC
jgi:hypothetical protein